MSKEYKELLNKVEKFQFFFKATENFEGSESERQKPEYYLNSYHILKTIVKSAWEVYERCVALIENLHSEEEEVQSLDKIYGLLESSDAILSEYGETLKKFFSPEPIGEAPRVED